MASSGGHQQTHKISPRKFSEKIALLNKKEAEGNAEFEEIIKEVQATRSHSAHGGGVHTNRSERCSPGMYIGGQEIDGLVMENLTSEQQDELEEVYQNLVKVVNECDGHQQQDPAMQLGNTTTMGNFEGTLFNNNSMRPASAGLQGSSQQQQITVPTTSTLPLNQSPSVNIINNNDLNQFIPYASSTTTSKHQNNHISGANSEYPFYAQGADTAGTNNISCRARGTSIGSTHYKHISANSQQPRTYPCNNNINNNNDSNINQVQPGTNAIGGLFVANGGREIYLKPAYDRSWQKSSSDPTLHAPCNPQNNSNQNNILASSCLDDLLADHHMMMDIQECHTQNQVNKIPARLNDNSLPLTIDDAEQQENVGPASSYESYLGSSYQMSKQQQEPYLQIDQNQIQLRDAPATEGPATRIIEAASQMDEASSQRGFKQMQYSTNDNIEIRGDLPGIKICAIDDDSLQQHRFESNGVVMRADNISGGIERTDISSRESSLPDLANLQFGYDKNPAEAEINNDKWTPPINGAPLDMEANYFNGPYVQPDGVVAADGWSNVLAMGTGGLYEPKQVNNLLSNSEHGLSHQQLLNTNDFCNTNNNNMIRSHSHSSIDYLTRQKTRQSAANYSSGQPACYQTPQAHHQQYQNCTGHLQANQRLKYSSGSSMRPQHGSISPLDSSSNLTSPQSEQNSPGSSTTEYGEPLQQQAVMGQEMSDGNATYIGYQQEDDRNLICESSDNFGAPHQQETQPSAAYLQGQYCNLSHDQFQQQPSNIQEEVGSFGPCLSLSSSRRLHNQACRGSYSMQFASTGGSAAAAPANATTIPATITSRGSNPKKN